MRSRCCARAIQIGAAIDGLAMNKRIHDCADACAEAAKHGRENNQSKDATISSSGTVSRTEDCSCGGANEESGACAMVTQAYFGDLASRILPRS